MRYVIRTSGGWVRVLDGRCDQFEEMYRIGCAEITAATTVRPAFREMIDTLRWSDIR